MCLSCINHYDHFLYLSIPALKATLHGQALLNPPRLILNSSQVPSVSKYSACALLNFTETILKQLHADPKLARCFDSFIQKNVDVFDTMLIILDFRSDEKVKQLKIHDHLLHTLMHEVWDTSVRHKRIKTVGVLLMTCARNYSGNNAHLLILPSLCALAMWGFQTAVTSLTGLELQLLWQKNNKTQRLRQLPEAIPAFTAHKDTSNKLLLVIAMVVSQRKQVEGGPLVGNILYVGPALPDSLIWLVEKWSLGKWAYMLIVKYFVQARKLKNIWKFSKSIQMREPVSVSTILPTSLPWS